MELKCEFDDGAAWRAALGLIVLKTDETLENEVQELFHRPGVVCRYVRIASHDHVTPENLARMERALPTAAALLPQRANIKAIGYGCTSAATVIGADRVAEIVQTAHPGVPVTDPISSVIAALRALCVDQISLLTPYAPDVTDIMQSVLVSAGVRIARVASFDQSEDRWVARITEAATLQAILDIGADPATDAVFASCTNLRTFGILAKAEAMLGKPVVSSNQALVWHMLRLAGLPTDKGPGRLFQM